MGVDIATYRCRIGSFGHRLQIPCNLKSTANISFVLEDIGSVVFVGLLLIIAGIEQNPGPNGKGKPLFERVLSKSLPDLVEKLDADSMLDFLVAKETITQQKARDIKEEKKTSDVIRELISYVKTRGERVFNTFKEGLMRTKQNELEERLRLIEDELYKERKLTELVSKDSDDLDSDQDYSDAIESLEQTDVQRDADVDRILHKFGLEDKMKNKIQVSDVVQFEVIEDVDNLCNDRDVPIMLLQHILLGDSDALDYSSYHHSNQDSTKGSMNSLFAPDVSNDVSPLDLFVLVYQYCDPLLKQLLFQKLYLAKIAFPFLYREYPFVRKVLSLWPLNFLVTETTCETKFENQLREVEMLDLPCYSVSFARFGRPKFSKSKLMNSLLCDTGADTFFHKDRPLGMTTRYASQGYIEMFYVPYVDGGSSRFHQSMMFLNLRGDFNSEENFSRIDRDFITTVTETVVIILDLETFLHETPSLQETVESFHSVVLLFVSEIPLNNDIRKEFKDFETKCLKRDKSKLHVISTYKGTKERNSTEIISDVMDALQKVVPVERSKLVTIRSKIEKSYQTTDEGTICKEALKSVNSLMEEIETLSSQKAVTESVTPVQSINTKILSTLIKERYRNKDPKSCDYRTNEITQRRKINGEQITQPVKLFSKCLVENRERHLFLQFYLCWLKLFLDRKKRMSFQSMLDTEFTKASIAMKDMAFLEIEHLFREIGHICDMILISGACNTKIDFPDVNELGNVISDLMVRGYSVELLDGEHLFIPTEWIKLILTKVNRKINEKQLLVLSVLGVQSSGKSTLLNTMFGLQFPTSCGRCTRGIHMRLVPIVKKNKLNFEIPYQYILVIDTEGIRAPEYIEIQESNYKRDNELSTIINGLGDITILNVMGESILEMHDVLQILAHALLRLKLANNRIDIRKCCFLTHQNVSDMQAPIKLKEGLANALKILDTATKEAAEYEGISDISSFNDVIKFDKKSNVFYFPNLWHGNPPMASINRKYCKRVHIFSKKILQESLYDRQKSFKNLEDIATHVDDLWKGVMEENFVFSFRNNIEKKAYIELEKFVKDMLWDLERSYDDDLFPLAQNLFSKCDDNDNLRLKRIEIIQTLTTKLLNHKKKAIDSLESFFEENRYKEMIIKWKTQTLHRLDMFCQTLAHNRCIDIDNMLKKREADIMINIMCAKHEEELRKKSIELANELRKSGRVINKDKSDDEFIHIWKTIEADSLSTPTTEANNISLKDNVISCLQNIFESHTGLLNRFLEKDKFEEDLKTNFKCLSGSFGETDITVSDISLPEAMEGRFKIFKSEEKLNKKYEEKLKLAKDATEEIFRIMDIKVVHICGRNEAISDRDVKQLLHEANEQLEDISMKQSQHYTLTTNFKIKTLIHISKYIFQRFETENTVYQQSNSILARLDVHRKQMQERFYAYVEDRKAEDTAAFLMHGTIENILKEIVEQSLSRWVKETLNDRLPPLKYYLLLNILTELINYNDFDKYKSYILNPKGHAFILITQKANKCLFTENIYSDVAERNLSKLFDEMKYNLRKSEENFKDSSSSFEDWLEHFISINETFPFPNDCFSNVAKELKGAEQVYIVDFVNRVIEKLDKSQKMLVDMYRNTTAETVRWVGCNPIDTIFEDLWGCPEQCIFCGEPCMKGQIHDKISHICMHHRPLGSSGVFEENTGNILLTSCNVNITRDADVSCASIDFKCNPLKRVECEKKRHKFKDYKSIAGEWDIEPDKGMENCSLFWMWFMGKYKQQLGEYFGIKTTNIPSEWEEIQEKMAISSVSKMYLAKYDRI